MFRGNVGITDSASYNGANPEYGTGRDTKAQLTLSNGAEVWDISGNVMEWVDSPPYPQNLQPTAWDGTTEATTSGWSDYAAGSLSRYLKEFPEGSPFDWDDFGSSNHSYNANHGIGRIWHFSNNASATHRVVLRGGYWSDSSNAGAFSVLLNFTAGTQSYGIGFRCASDPADISQSYNPTGGLDGGGAQKMVVGGNVDAKLYQLLAVGDGQTYTLQVLAKNDSGGGVVDASVAQLLVGGEALETAYTEAGDGWYRLSAEVDGVAEAREYGAVIRSGSSVMVDGWVLAAVDDAPPATPMPSGEGDAPVLTIKNGATFMQSKELALTGTAPAGAEVEVEVRSSVQMGRVIANSQGVWQWQPPETLEPGQHRYRARIVAADGSYGPWSEYHAFQVLAAGSGEIPSTGGNLHGVTLIGWMLVGVGLVGWIWRATRSRS